MSFGQNLVFLRKMHNQMTQEELAEKMGVSRQTISKWELDNTYPEINKVIELCKYFSCSMDELIRTDMNVCDEAFSNIRIEEVPAFKYLRYAVISVEPEEDAIKHVKDWAAVYGIENPDVIGWDFPVLSQEQINVHHMHGYAAAWVLPEGFSVGETQQAEVIEQHKQEYLAITIKEPFRAPFQLIPNAYKTLLSHMQVNQLSKRQPEGVIGCFEKEYTKDGIVYMDVYIGITRE